MPVFTSSCLARAGGLQCWTFRGRTLLPVVQGGMGVGVSAGGLAGTVASFGALGTISSVDLRRLHPDLWDQTGELEGPEAKARIDLANREALDREIRRARGIAQGHGLIAVNVLLAVGLVPSFTAAGLGLGVLDIFGLALAALMLGGLGVRVARNLRELARLEPAGQAAP